MNEDFFSGRPQTENELLADCIFDFKGDNINEANTYDITHVEVILYSEDAYLIYLVSKYDFTRYNFKTATDVIKKGELIKVELI